jgi:magnesium-transporting ATPase (P-type)
MENVTFSLGKIGFIGALIMLSAILLHSIAELIEYGEVKGNFWDEIIQGFVYSVTLILVCIPESLPLTLTMSLVFSVYKLR